MLIRFTAMLAFAVVLASCGDTTEHTNPSGCPATRPLPWSSAADACVSAPFQCWYTDRRGCSAPCTCIVDGGSPIWQCGGCL